MSSTGALAISSLFVEVRPEVEDDQSISLPTRLKRQRARTLAVEKELARLCELIIRDFLEYWFVKVSRDKEFLHNIRWCLEHIVFLGMSRLLRVNWTDLFLRKALPVISDLLALYNDIASKESLGNTLSNLPLGDSARIKAIREKLEKRYVFHVAVQDEGTFLRNFASALIGSLLEPTNFECRTFRSCLREILGARVLSSLAGFATPYWVNYGLWCLPDLNNPPDPTVIYYGPGYARTELQKRADAQLEKRLKSWEEEKARRMRNMEALVESDFDLNSLQLRFDAMWDLKIVGIKQMTDPKPFVTYELRVQNGDYTWHINKRFTEFKTLHSRLKRRCPGFSVKLPRAYPFANNMDREFINRRRHALQAYLVQLAWDRKVSESQEFINFLVEKGKNIKVTKTGHRSSMMVGQAIRRIKDDGGLSGKIGFRKKNHRTATAPQPFFNGLSKSVIMRTPATPDSFTRGLHKKGQSLERGKRPNNMPLSTTLPNRGPSSKAPPPPAKNKFVSLPSNTAISQDMKSSTSNKPTTSKSIAFGDLKTRPRKLKPRRKHISTFSSSQFNSTSTNQAQRETHRVNDDQSRNREIGLSLLDLAERLLDLDPNAYAGHIGVMGAKKGHSEGMLGDFVISKLDEKLNATNVQWLLRFIREQNWYEGKEINPGADPTPEETAEALREGHAALHRFIGSLPWIVRLVVTPTIIDGFFEFVQIEPILKHLLFTTLEAALLDLFPELQRS